MRNTQQRLQLTANHLARNLNGEASDSTLRHCFFKRQHCTQRSYMRIDDHLVVEM